MLKAIWSDTIDLYLPEAGEVQIFNRYFSNATTPHIEPVSMSVSLVETLEGVLKAKLMGGPFHMEEYPEAQTFIDFLKLEWILDVG